MPEISIRGLEMPESPTRKLSSLAVAEQNRGLPEYSEKYQPNATRIFPLTGYSCLQRKAVRLLQEILH